MESFLVRVARRLPLARSLTRDASDSAGTVLVCTTGWNLILVPCLSARPGCRVMLWVVSYDAPCQADGAGEKPCMHAGRVLLDRQIGCCWLAVGQDSPTDNLPG